MDRRYAPAIAAATGRPLSHHRQVLRRLREHGLVPANNGSPPTARHIARIVLALAGDNVVTAVDAVKTLRGLPLRSPCELPSHVEDALARLIETIPASPVVGDVDVDAGTLHLGSTSVTLDALSLTGKPVSITYGEPADGIDRQTSISISTIREVADAINRNQP